jgi:hypothetical protein
MCSNRLLATDEMRYFVGEEGENTFGRRNFLELVSVFTSAPVLAVALPGTFSASCAAAFRKGCV